MTHQWLGPNHRRSFWAVSPGGAVCLGYVEVNDLDCGVFVPREAPSASVPTDAACLRRCDDAESAAKAMCVYWRVPYLPLEPDTTGDDL